MKSVHLRNVENRNPIILGYFTYVKAPKELYSLLSRTNLPWNPTHSD